MSNDYFDSSDFTDLARGTLARAEEVNAIFDAVVVGFDRLPALAALNENRVTYAADVGGDDTYVATIGTIAAYTAGLRLSLNITTANTGAATINLNSIGAKTIKRFDGATLVSGDIPALSIAEMVYDGTDFRLVSPNGSDVSAAAASAVAAASSASAASTSASSASSSASAASSSASSASTSASTATTQASNASTSASNAATSETNAATSASTATTQASNAATSASTATTQASNASTSASTASTQASNASTSASNAATSASTASTQATNASNSASSASTSASTASTQATNASNSASSASTSASTASTQATNASNSASAAAASYAAAAAVLANAQWAAAGGVADALTAAFPTTVTSVTDGLILGVRALLANATTTPTFSPDGLTARVITKSGNVALAAGDIAGVGHELLLRYRASGTKWELLNPAVVASATISASIVTGTTTNDNAAAGYLGEIIEATLAGGSALSVTSGTILDLTSISLTAGDWDVWGSVITLPASGTVQSEVISWGHTVSATFPTKPNGGCYADLRLTFSATTSQSLPTGMRRLSLSGTTTVYLSARITFTVSTLTAYGYIGARRVR